MGEPQFGIYTGSSQKALAWEFIKFCIQEKEYDFNGGENAYYNYVETFGTPINRNNAKKIYEYFTNSDEEMVDWFIRNDESRNLQCIPDSILEYTFNEFLSDYHKGNITAEECAQLMQERAVIYMKE